jgi:excisionase family DNA binding protein
VLGVASRYGELGQALLPLMNATLHDKYGIEMTSLIVENVSVPAEVEAAIDKRSSLAAIGNLNDYVKMQIGRGVGSGSAGLAGVGAELAAGLSLGQQLAGQAGFGAPALDVLSPAQVAALLKVKEADVIASLESGDLKGKRIGSEWRIMRAAVDAFMK